MLTATTHLLPRPPSLVHLWTCPPLLPPHTHTWLQGPEPGGWALLQGPHCGQIQHPQLLPANEHDSQHHGAGDRQQDWCPAGSSGRAEPPAGGKLCPFPLLRMLLQTCWSSTHQPPVAPAGHTSSVVLLLLVLGWHKPLSWLAVPSLLLPLPSPAPPTHTPLLCRITSASVWWPWLCSSSL